MSEKELIARAIIIELESLEGSVIGYQEALATANRVMNEARKLALINIKEAKEERNVA